MGVSPQIMGVSPQNGACVPIEPHISNVLKGKNNIGITIYKKSHHYHYALFLDGDVVNKSLPPEHIVAYIKFDNLTIKCTKKLY